MPSQFQVSGAANSGQTLPLSMAAVGVMGQDDIGLFGLITAVRKDSNPILGVGFNSFMCLIAVEDNSADFSVSQCDPITGAILVVEVVNFVVPGSTITITFGAFAPAGGGLSSEAWHTFRIGLRCPIGTAPLVGIDLYAGTR